MDGQWLKTQFANNPDKTKAGLALAIGLEPPAISKILNGSRQIKAQEYILMREYFGLPSDGHAAVKGKVASYAVNLRDGKDGQLQDGSALPPDWVIPASITSQRAQNDGGKVRIFQVRDDLMQPDYTKGEHVLVDISDRKPEPAGTFIVSDGFSNMLRHCEYTRKPEPEIRVSGRGGGFLPQTLKPGDFLVIGRVIAKLQMV